MDGVRVGLVFGEEWVMSGDRFWYWNCIGELNVIGEETGSAEWWGAVGVLGVVSTKLGPADDVNDTAVGVEGVDVAEVVVRLVGGGGGG